jgi:hypothetical protein
MCLEKGPAQVGEGVKWTERLEWSRIMFLKTFFQNYQGHLFKFHADLGHPT